MANPWDKLKQKASELIPPVAVLREQARLLTEATEGVVQGYISTDTSHSGVTHSFAAMVPAMDNYTVHLLRVEHGMLVYPAFVDAHWWRERRVECSTKDELADTVVRFLSNDYVQKVVASLMAQAVSAE